MRRKRRGGEGIGLGGALGVSVVTDEIYAMSTTTDLFEGAGEWLELI